jgi:ubiquinone/menaquinone biosynthesis C-methylase UbiE
MSGMTGGNVLIDLKLILSKIHIQENMKIADLGCGSSGHFVFPIAALVGKTSIVYAVDILKTILETIDRKIKQENIKNIITVWSDLEIFGATGIESGSLDVGFLINTLYQSKNRLNIIRETIRMLKKGGSMIIVEWKNSSLPFGPPAGERVKEEALKITCQKLGLKLEEEFIPGQYHFGLVFTKI